MKLKVLNYSVNLSDAKLYYAINSNRSIYAQVICSISLLLSKELSIQMFRAIDRSQLYGVLQHIDA